MLHLERKKGQGIVIEINGQHVEFYVSELSRNKVKLSFDHFSKDVVILRDELYWGEDNS